MNSSDPKDTSRGKSCIWFEPSESLLVWFTRMLGSAGFETDMATRVAEVVYSLQRHRIPDYFIMKADPKGEVVRLAAALASLEKTRDRPVILYGRIPNAPLLPPTVIPVPTIEHPEEFIRILHSADEQIALQRRTNPPPVSDEPANEAFLAEQLEKANTLVGAIGVFEGIVRRVQRNELPGPIAPRFLTEARELLVDPLVDIRSVSRFLARHQAASARILGLANSAFYRRGASKIDSIGVAIQRLGLRQVSLVAQAIAMQGYIVGRDPGLRRLVHLELRKSLATALCCEELAKIYAHGDPSHLYTVGLFHNIGSTFFYYALALVNDRERVGKFDYEALQAAAAQNGTRLNRVIAHQLSLPDDVINVYMPDQSVEDPKSKLGIVYQALWLAAQLLETSSPLSFTPEAAVIGLTQPVIDELTLKAGWIRSIVSELHDVGRKI